MNELFNDMQSKGLISTSSSWIEMAVHQKNPKLTLEVANTTRYSLCIFDIKILSISRLN